MFSVKKATITKPNNAKISVVKINWKAENILKKEVLSSISETIKPLLKKAKKYSFNFVLWNPFKRKTQSNNNIKIMVTQFVETSIFSIACKLFGFLRLTQN